jgi:hypothetical protein
LKEIVVFELQVLPHSAFLVKPGFVVIVPAVLQKRLPLLCLLFIVVLDGEALQVFVLLSEVVVEFVNPLCVLGP